jgi:dipeptidyl aminopeptidase/acylaminoacyl peptidase
MFRFRTLALVASTSFVVSTLEAQNAPGAPAIPAANGARSTLKELDPADLTFWKSPRSVQLSLDGKWFAYQVAPNEGDGEVVVRPTGDGKEMRFPIGEPQTLAGGFNDPNFQPPSPAVQISGDTKWVAFTKYPAAAEAKKLRKDRKPLQNAVSLLNLATGEVREFDKVRRFQFTGEKPSFLVMHRYAADGGGQGAGAELLVLDLRHGTVATIGNVGEWALDDAGGWLAWTVETRDRVGNGLQVRQLATDVVRVIDSESQLYRRLAWADSGLVLAVLRGKPDTVAKDTSYVVLGVSGFGGTLAKTMYAASDSTAFPADMRISPDRTPRWSFDRSALFFGIIERRSIPEGKPRPDVRAIAGTPGAMQQPPGMNVAGDEELPSLVIWHGKEPRLQSQQQVEENRDKAFSYLAQYRVAEKKFIRLGTTEMRDVVIAPRDRWAIGTDQRAYELRGNIDGTRFRDYYAIDLETGEKKPIITKTMWPYWASPDGNRVLYYFDGAYRVQDFATGATRNVSEGVPTTFVNTEDDHNIDRPPVNPLGWASDNQSVLLFDLWDVWRVPVKAGTAVNLTGNGKRDRIRYTRRLVVDPRERGIDLTKPLYLATYGDRTKKEGLSRVVPNKPGAVSMLWEDAKFFVQRARDAETFVFTKQTVKDFPDYWVADASFQAPKRLTDINPQQKDYRWPSRAQLIDYVSDKGDSLQAALWLPADYEPGKKYPTVVYIYEKLSQNLHTYAVPNETRALNPSVYTSRGFAVLQPDIVYRVNDPGMSAVWCVIPAVKAAIATGIVDPANVGLHGHSWGGYQTAFLVTQTNIFKSAIAGAALTDMVSMYSSIYWNSGSTNQPIFESSQGRFTGSFVDNPDAYIRNSPVFHANKVTTPLMLLHNEKDGAVDFNQGITYFNTLREQGKDVILLQYVGENHGLQQPKNQKDYTIRMREWFDHYLQGKPAPDWMTSGIPRLKMEEHLKSRQKKDKIAS